MRESGPSRSPAETLIQAVSLAQGPTEESQSARVAVFRTIRPAAGGGFRSHRDPRGQAPDPKIYPGDIIVVDGSGSRRCRNRPQNLPLFSIFGRSRRDRAHSYGRDNVNKQFGRCQRSPGSPALWRGQAVGSGQGSIRLSTCSLADLAPYPASLALADLGATAVGVVLAILHTLLSDPSIGVRFTLEANPPSVSISDEQNARAAGDGVQLL